MTAEEQLRAALKALVDAAEMAVDWQGSYMRAMHIARERAQAMEAAIAEAKRVLEPDPGKAFYADRKEGVD